LWLWQNSESAFRDAVSLGSVLLDHAGTLLECPSMLGVDEKMSDTSMSVGILDPVRCVWQHINTINYNKSQTSAQATV